MEILIKGKKLYCRHCTPADKYVDPPEGPNEFDLENITKRVYEFLRNEGKLIAIGINPFPYLEEGFITDPAQGFCYILGNCLVLEMLEPYGLFVDTGIKYKIMVMGKKENASEIENTLDLLVGIAGFKEYWYSDEDKTIKISTKPKNLKDLSLQIPNILKSLGH